MKKKFALLIGGSFLFALAGLGAEEAAVKKATVRLIEVVDTPTAEVVDNYGYYVSFRFGSAGALQAKPIFGIFPRLNLGFGLDGEKVLGTDDSKFNKPTLNVKYRLFDGKKLLPALALGFDGQGTLWNKDLDHYNQREMGFYVVATTEFILPDLNLSIGANNFDFEEAHAGRAFANASYVYERTLGLLLEYANASDYKDRRFNFGLKYFITPVFTVDLVGRNIPKTYRSEDRETERIVRLNYTGAF
ncbi:MAG: YjbH domain-containing protein [Elusimicrobia bacterium]|nr:YjbH domain-containing protein [Candidatus Obscuribacterium magneticum]